MLENVRDKVENDVVLGKKAARKEYSAVAFSVTALEKVWNGVSM